MGTIGGEVDQLGHLKANLDRQSRAIQELTSAVRADVDNTWWMGPAAERFRHSWSGEFEPALKRLQSALQDAAAEVSRRREALLRAGS